MSTRWLAMTVFGLSGVAFAQQVQNSAVTLPVVQAAGGTGNAGIGSDRPGGISYVTRQRPTIGGMSLANGFFAAGGVTVATTAGTAGVGTLTQSGPSAIASASKGSASGAQTAALDPQAVAALRRLAASGNRDAQRALASVGLGLR